MCSAPYFDQTDLRLMLNNFLSITRRYFDLAMTFQAIRVASSHYYLFLRNIRDVYLATNDCFMILIRLLHVS